MAFTPGVNYVAQRSDGSFAVVVDGVAVDSGNLTKQQAEQLFNAETASGGSNEASGGPVQDIRQQPTENIHNIQEGGTDRGSMVSQNPDGTWSAWFQGFEIGSNFPDQNSAQTQLNTHIRLAQGSGIDTSGAAQVQPGGTLSMDDPRRFSLRANGYGNWNDPNLTAADFERIRAEFTGGGLTPSTVDSSGQGGTGVQAQRQELFNAGGDSRWLDPNQKSDAQVTAEWTRILTAAGDPRATQGTGGFTGGFTATGGIQQAQLEATLAQQAAELELERQRLFGRDIPQLVGQAVSPLDLQNARIQVWEASGRDDFWLQAPPTRVIAEFQGLTANDPTQTELRNRLLQGVPTLQRQELEHQQLLDFAQLTGDPRSLVPALQLASAVGLDPGVNFPGLASVTQNQPLGTNTPAFRFNFGGVPSPSQEGVTTPGFRTPGTPILDGQGNIVPEQGGQTDQFGFPILTPSLFGNPQTTTQLGGADRQRIQSIVGSQGRFEPSSFFGQAEQFFPQAPVSTSTRTGLTPSTF